MPNRSASLNALMLVALVMLTTFVVGLYSQDDDAPHSDEIVYLRHAWSVFQFSTFGAASRPDASPPPAADIAPGYPVFVAMVLRASTSSADGLRCVLWPDKQESNGCTAELDRVRFVQLAVWSVCAGLLFVWLFPLLGSRKLAFAAIVILAASGAIGYFTSRFLTESLYVGPACLFMVAYARAIDETSSSWTVVAGAILGVVALIRPNFFHLSLLLSCALPLLMTRRGATVRAAVRRAAMFLLTFLVVISPWLMRNTIEFDRTAITVAYGSRALSTRLAYNDMTRREWVAGWIYWLPDFGDKLARNLWGDEASERLDLGSPMGFYQAGRGTMRAEVLAATGVDLDSHTRQEAGMALSWLVRNKVLGEPVRHAAVTLLLAWRGLFVQKYFGLIGALALVVGVVRRRTMIARPLYLLLLPAAVLLLFNAAISLNIPRYNLILLLPMSIAIAALGRDCIAAGRQFFRKESVA